MHAIHKFDVKPSPADPLKFIHSHFGWQPTIFNRATASFIPPKEDSSFLPLIDQVSAFDILILQTISVLPTIC